MTPVGEAISQKWNVGGAKAYGPVFSTNEWQSWKRKGELLDIRRLNRHMQHADCIRILI